MPTSEYPTNGADDLAFATNSWGVTLDCNLTVTDPEVFRNARRWADGLNGSGLERVSRRDADAPFIFETDGHGRMEIPGAAVREGLGGNTMNTWLAALAALHAVQPTAVKHIPLHGFSTPKLEAALDGLREASFRLPPVILETRRNARIRCNHVVMDVSGEDPEPLYLSRPPHPIETGPLPSASRVFLSSGGADVEASIAAFKGTRLYLAPGKAQTRRGLAPETFAKAHFLSVNLLEARALAAHVVSLDTGSGVSVPEDPLDLVCFFHDLGPREVRITDGLRGVYALLEGDHQPVHMGSFSLREYPDIAQGYQVENWATPDQPANPVGCGDARLGAELAGQWIFPENPRASLAFAGAVGALQACHSGSSNINFPPQLFEHLADKVSRLRWMLGP